MKLSHAAAIITVVEVSIDLLSARRKFSSGGGIVHPIAPSTVESGSPIFKPRGVALFATALRYSLQVRS